MLRLAPELRELLLVVGGTVLVLAVTLLLQTPCSPKGFLWDGAAYHHLARQFADGSVLFTAKPDEQLRGSAPFAYRVGQPWLAAQLAPESLRNASLAIGLASAMAQVIFFWLCLRETLNQRWVRLLCVLCFVMAFHSLVRFLPYRPYMVDDPAGLLLFLGFWCVLRFQATERVGFLIAAAGCCTVGAAFRESVLVAGVAALFAGNPLRFERQGWLRWLPRLQRGDPKRLWPRLIPIIGGIVVTCLVHEGVAISNKSEALANLARNFVAKKPHTYVLAWFIAYGPFLLVALAGWRRQTTFLLERQPLLAALAAVSLLSWIGGSDTERLLFWAAPIVFVMIGRELERNPPRRWLGSLLPLLAAQALAHRWPLLLPPPGEASDGLLVPDQAHFSSFCRD
ncbi:MAG: hypothetical protein MJD61_17375 [Proteobacteria bacterium]|nr:hypothetical protein [Pseudomonadota bacterium]